MAKVIVTESNLEDIGDALRDRLQTSDEFLPSQMASAIRSIGGNIEIDTTLTQHGAAAEAYTVGARLEGVATDINNVQGYAEDALDASANNKNLINVSCNIDAVDDYTWDAYIYTNVSTGDTVSLTPVSNDNFCCKVISCYDGDRITVTGRGGGDGRLWAFLDSGNSLLSKAPVNITAKDFMLVAPEGARKCVINSYSDSIGGCFKGVSTKTRLNQVMDVEGTFTNLRYIYSFVLGKAVATNVGVGNYVNVNQAQDSANFAWARAYCTPGEKVRITGQGGSTGRLWAFLDSDSCLISCAEANAVGMNTLLTVPDGARWIVLNMVIWSIGANWVGTPIDDRISGLVDSSLSIGGKAADAAQTGYSIQRTNTIVRDVERAANITSIQELGFVEGKYIQTNVEVGETVALASPQSSSSFKFAVALVSYGQRITLNATGGNAGRLWAFLDPLDKLVAKADINEVATDLVLTVPVNVAKVVLNFNTNEVIGANYLGTSVDWRFRHAFTDPNNDGNIVVVGLY